MDTERTPAIWSGPFAAELPDMSLVYPGEQHLVTSEDLRSAHWTAVDDSGNPLPDPEPTPEPEPEPEPAPLPPTFAAPDEHPLDGSGL